MTDLTVVPPAVRAVRERFGTDHYTLGEVARALGITRHYRLRDLANRYPELGPSYATWVGAMKVFVYDDADVAALVAHFASSEPGGAPRARTRAGRPSLWSREEYRARQRLWSSAHHFRARASRLHDVGQTVEAERCERRVAEIVAELDEQASRARAERLRTPWRGRVRPRRARP